jgi:phosphoesterase RecJ-like protein
MLLCHHNADPDTLCAAYGLQELALTLDPTMKVDIILTGGASNLSRKIMAEIGIEAHEISTIKDVDAFVMLDVATLTQLEDWADVVVSTNLPIVFIDHHASHPESSSISELYIVDEGAYSTCEMIYGLYENFGIEPSARVSKALLIGMAYDSKHFSMGSVNTFKAVSRLLELNGQLDEITELLSTERKRPERIARLKAAMRMQLHMVDDWTIVTSHLSSFQASAARAMISLGADVSIVVGKDKRKLRVSMRSTERFYKVTTIHLGRDVALKLGEAFTGAGSGHPTAAGVNGEGAPEAMVQMAIDLITEKIRE